MPLTTTNIIGPVLLPSGLAPSSGYVRFILDGFDTDTGQLVAPASVRADIGAGGAFTAALWPNSRGLRGTHYGVFLGVLNALGAAEETALGLISVPQSATPIELEDLLGLPILPGYTATLVLTQAEYDAIAVKNPLTLYLIKA